ncbi:MAG: hypothetical protein Q8M17_01160 [Actinomycetota bacterium]|jgi:hypothetical protein|nr:hypothetical protein [Actinomycetota bacterium]
MTDKVARAASPDEVARVTELGFDGAGDTADQADRLTMIMAAEATHNALNGGGGEGSLEDLPYPLEDIEDLLAMEDAEDGSDDPMHAGGLTPAPWLTAEQAAMHVIDPEHLDDTAYLDDETDAERADPQRDQFDGPPHDLTPEDVTILGIDPYDEPAAR